MYRKDSERRNRKTEEVYNLPKKELVEWGYSLLDEMREDYAKMPKKEMILSQYLLLHHGRKIIL